MTKMVRRKPEWDRWSELSVKYSVGILVACFMLPMFRVFTWFMSTDYAGLLCGFIWLLAYGLSGIYCYCRQPSLSWLDIQSK